MSSVKMIHSCSVASWSAHMCTVYVNKHTNTRREYKPKRSKHTDTCRLPLWILWRQQGKYLCFESITSHIFIFLSPCCYNFLPCQTNQNAKTKRRLKEQLRFSTVRFTNALLLQTGSVQGDMTCVCVCGSVCCVCVKRALVLIFTSAKTVQFILFKLHLKRINITLANNHQSIIS